ncbi:MAG TPA: tetratricopeptide repeat protein [Planctomycetota bacterium]|nr:tetratricopeptide repeat protein [Planctomycetota bacterium]
MKRFRLWLGVTGTITLVAAVGGVLVWRETPRFPPDAGAGRAGSGSLLPPAPPNGRREDGAFAGSAACGPCHPREVEAWRGSHHALAERPLDPARDGAAFHPPRKVRHGSRESTIGADDGRLALETDGQGGVKAWFTPVRVIGVAPLEQFLIPFPGGRFQAMSLAFDRLRDEWFDVFGTEDRQPHEWGYWSSRGMTWNSMCATCHMTALEKGYDPARDAYSTKWVEAGVGCEACHGPLAGHAGWHAKAKLKGMDPSHEPPGLRPVNGKVTDPRIIDTCGTCHARRAELTGAFRPGDDFLDHFYPVLPDSTDTYYPDGQVRDENYEYGSFLLSRMHAEGVRCVSCHDPHTGRTRKQGNDLCLGCHAGKIDPGPHSRHDPAGTGGQCTACHMPVTVYMQRHPRRDHGFTIPDPLLTREYGVPNACNRCHSDRTVEWAISAMAERRSNAASRPSGARARAVARARLGLQEGFASLERLAREDRQPAWRAVAAGLLGHSSRHPATHALLRDLLRDPSPLVRASAARALDPEEAREGLRALLDDPVRIVRIEAAWALRRELRLDSRAGMDLDRQLREGCDQPQGALRLSMFLLDRGDANGAASWIEKAVEWDPGSPGFRQAQAVISATRGDTGGAIRALEEAAKLAPDNPEHPFELGLAHAEAGDLDLAIRHLARASEMEPRFARAWYNLGLARARNGLLAEGIEALQRAGVEDPSNADYPLARALVLLEHGLAAEAREAALEAVRIDPRLPRAIALLAEIEEAARAKESGTGRR